MNTLKEWTAAVCADLGLDPACADTTIVLDVARDAAHGVARPAAPLTAYLLGVAVGQGMALPDAAGRISALAARWPAPAEPGERLPDSYGSCHRPAAEERSHIRRSRGADAGRAKGGR